MGLFKALKSALGGDTIDFLKNPSKQTFNNIAKGGASSSVFGLAGGDYNEVTPAVAEPPPTIDQAEVAAEVNSDMLRRRRGKASTILSGKDGSAVSPQNIATKILLGM